jgi:FkbM family methyltransferase
MFDALSWPCAAIDAWRGKRVRVGGVMLEVPGTRRERLSVVAGNLRIHRLLDRSVKAGDTVVDVGANIGWNAIRAARLAGPRGRVVAVEPTPDTLEVLRRNVAASGLGTLVVEPVAAGSAGGTRDFFVRGGVSAVNSLYPDSRYARVTEVLRVPVVRLDDLVEGAAAVVKIDVEGAELDVLEGATRLLAAPGTVLIVEWDPLLQEMAGHGGDELPRWLLERGWRLQAASHLAVSRLGAADLPALAASLERRRGMVELVASRGPPGFRAA